MRKLCYLNLFADTETEKLITKAFIHLLHTKKCSVSKAHKRQDSYNFCFGTTVLQNARVVSSFCPAHLRLIVPFGLGAIILT